MFRRSLALALVAGLLLLAACAGPSRSTSTDQSQPGGQTAAEGKADLNFTVATLDGKTFDGTTLAGKPAVLWFWAPWCPTCLGQAPAVKQAATTYDGKVTFVGVAGLDNVSEMREFVDLTKLDNIPHLADEQGVVWKRFQVTQQSVFVLLDASGRITHRGHLDGSELDAKIAPLAG
jgi:thiol-disulfide isomerase/thioredoxin